ncbi:MAG: DUF5060 domain-containing protein [Opitutaceae bacterium]|nr:DUF5060 domain-containing protein [Opitutaceae bacterium]
MTAHAPCPRLLSLLFAPLAIAGSAAVAPWVRALLALSAIAGANLRAAPHFTREDERAVKFGVHEIRFRNEGYTGNPFDIPIRVTFTPASGAGGAKTVDAFYDGETTWAARVYVSEPGRWRWSVDAPAGPGVTARAGEFRAGPSTLRGRLLPHTRNPRQWMTEDGRWFLNLNDTAYFLFSPADTMGRRIGFDDFATYVRHVQMQGITSLRAWLVFDRDGRWSDEMPEPWVGSYFTDGSGTQLCVGNFQRTDERMSWLLNHAPDVYLQLIMLPRGSRYGKDEEAWRTFSPEVKQRVLRHIVARYAAFPQVYWLAVNDAHYGKGFPHHNTLAREVGEYLKRHDPWQHPYSTGPARQLDAVFAHEPWCDYVHLERRIDLAARALPAYLPANKPILNGEDYYEQDHLRTDPDHMSYFQRRLFWAWLFSGGSANYGGRWNVLHPYRLTEGREYERPRRRPDEIVYTAGLHGLDSVPHLTRYFDATRLDLGDFEPDTARVGAPDKQTPEGEPKLMRRGMQEWLVYHPNAAADGKTANVAADRTAKIRLDLRGVSGALRIEWYRPADGLVLTQGTVDGGAQREFSAPWIGHDVVLRLSATK